MSDPLIPHASHGDLSPAAASLLTRIVETEGYDANLYHTAAHSEVVLKLIVAYLGIASETRLSSRIRAGIALRVSELNGCDYCLAAHTTKSRALSISDTDALDFRRGRSSEPLEQALLALTTRVLRDRGCHAGLVVQAARCLGATDAEMIEALAWIAWNQFLNYLSSVAQLDVDFPDAPELDSGEVS